VKPAARVAKSAGRVAQSAGRVILPILAALTLLLPAGCTNVGHATPIPSGATPVVVTFGDSVPAGTACNCAPFPDLYAHLLSPDAASVNLARPGCTSQDVRQQLATPPAEAAVHTADIVLVMAGANDLGEAFDSGAGSYAGPAAQVEQNLAAVVSGIHALRGAGVHVLVFGYWDVVEDGDVGRSDYGEDGLAEAHSATTYANDAIRAAAAASGAKYVDTTAVFKGDTGERNPTALLASDGDHPNAAGHEAIAEAAYTVLPAG
jgi:acyl-CoA thioesterase-1